MHFPDGEAYEALAVQVLSIAEEQHASLVPFFNSAPDYKTQLVLSDDQDFANGWASFFPFPQIRLYITPPYEVNGLENYSDWLTLLIRHEYVHILHMETVTRSPDSLQRIFGRLPVLFPHALTTPMLIEGLAVYLETDYEAGTGRLASTWYQMQMEQEVLSGEFSTMDQAAMSSSDWPYGQYYLYGAFFVEYLIQTYGEAVFQEWLKYYSGVMVPFIAQNASARQIYGKSFSDLWEDFRVAMEVRFGGGKAVITDSSPDMWRQQVTTANEEALYFVARNDEDKPELRRCIADECDVIAEADRVADIDVTDSGNIAAVINTQYASGRLSGDIWLLDEDSDWQRLTTGARISLVRWLPDGSGFLASSFREGASHLLLISPEGDESVLWRGGYGEYIGEFDIAPDGKVVTAAYKRPGFSWDLASSTADDIRWELLTDTPETEASPRYSGRDNGELLYVADYGSRFAAWQWDSVTPVVLRTSDSGAFDPWLTGDRLWIQEYSARGFRLHNAEDMRTSGMASQAELSTPSSLTTGHSADWRLPEPVVTGDVVEYTPWKTLRPYFWLPYFNSTDAGTDFGVSLMGSDALGRHAYELAVSTGVDGTGANAYLAYQ
ncbi:MAG: hypothetical protein VW274_01175, partial [Thalassolituus sp.]